MTAPATQAPPLTMPTAWHEQVEHENAVSYHQGYQDGYAAAEQAIAEEITRAVGVPALDFRAVIRWLVRTTGDARPSTPYGEQEA